MIEYISREAAIEALEQNWSPDTEFEAVIGEIPAADVRPVVLCRDCKWCHSGYCEKYDDLIPFGHINHAWENWFCAAGERPNCGADMRPEQPEEE